MEQTVYVDIFFLINFSMDFLGLFLSARLLSRRVKTLRLLLSALFGALYACLTLFLTIGGAWGLAIDALACLAMGAIAVFGLREKRSFLYFSLVFGAISILLGGAMTALFYLFNRIGVSSFFANGESGDGASVWIFLALAALSGAFTLLGGRAIKARAGRACGKIEIEYQKKKIALPCLCDSGNLLREPISQTSCIIVELDAVSSILPPSLVRAIRDENISALDGEEARRIRLVPTHSATGRAMLFGIRPDALRIDMGKGASAVDAYIVFSVEKISAKGVRALVPSELALGAE